MATLTPYKGGAAGVRLPIDRPLFRIGRDPSNDLCMDDDLVSREHAIIERAPSASGEAEHTYTIRDLKSTNGTFVNNKRIAEELLNEGDLIQVGKNFLLFSLHDDLPQGDLSATTKLHKTFIPGVYYTTTSEKSESKKRK